ncbi:nuclease [Micromonospora sp. NPDC048871]|uniref:nuclease n=1 Tax=unclassified Micromonospora TaxID=2617518 RepID=UPI002E14CD48|nr:NYN domain-containing protein [Micromonospora sp. NBC_01739]
MPGISESVTYLIVDGENIDATLGNSVLERRPAPAERPRWERLREFARDTWRQPVKGLFFLNASGGVLPMPFVRALLSMDYRPIPLAGSSDQKVVDIGIQRTLQAIARRPGNVMLASHDGDFLPQLGELLLDGDRQVAVVGFKEFLNAGFAELPGLQIFDIEEDADCFTNVLPRVRIIDLESFDPERFL